MPPSEDLGSERLEPLHQTATWLHDLAVMREVRLRKIKVIAETTEEVEG